MSVWLNLCYGASPCPVGLCAALAWLSPTRVGQGDRAVLRVEVNR
jgi:hypothetical protein